MTTQTTNDDDPIRPKHYAQHPSGVKCIDVIEWMPLNIGTAVKYLWRAGQKPGEAETQDLEKAVWYVERELDRMDRLLAVSVAAIATSTPRGLPAPVVIAEGMPREAGIAFLALWSVAFGAQNRVGTPDQIAAVVKKTLSVARDAIQNRVAELAPPAPAPAPEAP